MKKLIALILTLALALGLAACGGSTTTTPDVLDQDAVDVPEEPETPAVPENPEETPEQWEGDYETATFDDIRKYGIGSSRWDGSLPLTTTGEQLEFGLRVNARVTDYATNPQTVWLKEKTGIDISIREFVGSSSDISTQISLMFNGMEDMPDILAIDLEGTARRSEYLDAGYLVNVAGYMMTDSYYLKEALDLACKDDPVKYATLMNLLCNYSSNQQTGGVYGSCRIMDNPTDVVYTEAHVNVEWLEKLGLEKPTTIDELYNVLVAFRDRDPNGNGKKDEIPLMGLTRTLGRGVDHYIINAFIQYASARKVMIEDGKAFTYHTQDEYRQALIFMNKLVKEGLLSTLAFTGNATDLRKLLNPVGNEPYTIGICCAWITGDFQDASEALYKYESLPALKDCTGRGGYSLFDAPSVECTFGITYSCENVLLAFRLLDFMHSKEAYLVQRWGEEGVDWDWIENTQYKDLAAGNGVFGGDAKYVIYNRGYRDQSKWGISCDYADEMNLQVFVDPNSKDFVNTFYKKSANNVLMQKSIGEPEEQLLVFTRTPEEDELFHEYNSELSSLIASSMKMFCMGQLDPNDDAVWQSYLKDMSELKIERWTEIGQASYDRQKAELEQIKAQMGK